MTTTTMTPEHCFTKAAEALDAGNVEIAREWRQLGEAIASVKYVK